MALQAVNRDAAFFHLSLYLAQEEIPPVMLEKTGLNIYYLAKCARDVEAETKSFHYISPLILLGWQPWPVIFPANMLRV